MDLIAKLPCIAAKIYRNLYREGSSIGAIDSNLDWSHNFTNMLGYSDAQFTELMRLYLTIHRYNFKQQIIKSSLFTVFSLFHNSHSIETWTGEVNNNLFSFLLEKSCCYFGMYYTRRLRTRPYTPPHLSA